MVRLVRFVAAVALGGLAVAGLSSCSGANGGSGYSTASVRPTVSGVSAESTASVVSPEVPSAEPHELTAEEALAMVPLNARDEDFPSAVMFTRFFLELYAPMFSPPYDTSLFDYLCADTSQFCTSELEGVAATREQRGWSTGGEFTWYDWTRALGGLQSDGSWLLGQRFDREAATNFREDGSLLNEVPAVSGMLHVLLYYVDGMWQVQGVNLVYDGEEDSGA